MREGKVIRLPSAATRGELRAVPLHDYSGGKLVVSEALETCFGFAVALDDGTILLDGSERIELSAEDADQLWRALQRVTIAAYERRRVLAGDDRWRAVAVDKPLVLIRHDGEERLFRLSKVGRVKLAYRCAECKGALREGDEVLRERDHIAGQFGGADWSRVRLHPACVMPRRLGEVVEGGAERS